MKSIFITIFLCGISEISAQNIVEEDSVPVGQDNVISLFPETVPVQGGIFEMGSLYGELDEVPIHKVRLDDYEFGKYPITVAQYRLFCHATSRNMPEPPYWGWIDNHPMVTVSWDDAVAYTNWLSITTGESYRLPTEAEWEYSARGGVNSLGYKYSGGNEFDVLGQYEKNSEYKTHNVGRKFPNELDIYDLSGNVLEWTFDWYDPKYYAKSPVDNPKGPSKGEGHVLRGGSWYGNEITGRVSFRAYFPAGFRYNFIGFRVVKEKKKR